MCLVPWFPHLNARNIQHYNTFGSSIMSDQEVNQQQCLQLFPSQHQRGCFLHGSSRGSNHPSDTRADTHMEFRRHQVSRCVFILPTFPFNITSLCLSVNESKDPCLPHSAGMSVQRNWTDAATLSLKFHRLSFETWSAARRCCFSCHPSGAFCFLCVTHFCCLRLVSIREEACHRGGRKRPEQSHGASAILLQNLNRTYLTIFCVVWGPLTPIF